MIFNKNNLTYIGINPNIDRPKLSELDLKLNQPFITIIIAECQLSQDKRWQWAEWLVDNQCFWVMAHGIDCTLWDDEVDMVSIMREVDDISTDYSWLPDGQSSILTSWHGENETLADLHELVYESEHVLAPVLFIHFSDNHDAEYVLSQYLDYKNNHE